MTTQEQLLAETASNRFVCAANLFTLVRELVTAGITQQLAERVVGDAFKLGTDECSRIYQKVLGE